MMRALAALLLLMPTAAQAGLAVAANDGKQIVKGDPVQRTPDSISVLELGTYPPKVIGSVQVPASMIGSPVAVVVARDSSFALVTAAQKYDPAHLEAPPPDDKVSVIDLADPAHPKVVQTISSGADTAGGIAMNRAQNLVLIAAKTGDAIFALTLKDRKLTPAGKVDLGKGAAPTDVVFAPDGRKAYAVAWGNTKIMELAVDGTRVSRTGREVVTGKSPYGAVVTPDGAWLINTNVGGEVGGDGTGTLTIVDLKNFKLARSMPVGRVTEHITLSPDGRHAALILANGAATVKSDPLFAERTGILRIYAVGAGSLTPVAESPSCHWAQGGTWSDDGKLFLQQCATERAIQVFRFDGKSLIRDEQATLTFESRPGAIATALTR
jgi:DNA-binding beta-propeller fold protein YncE